MFHCVRGGNWEVHVGVGNDKHFLPAKTTPPPDHVARRVSAEGEEEGRKLGQQLSCGRTAQEYCPALLIRLTGTSLRVLGILLIRSIASLTPLISPALLPARRRLGVFIRGF